MDPALRELMAQEGDDQVEAVVRIAPGAEVPPQVHLVARFGDIATCRIPRARIAEIWADEALVSLKAPRLFGIDPDPVRSPAAATETEQQEAEADDVRRPEELAETGRGTVVGFVDWGFDFAHPNFRERDGSSRALALWDQSAPGPSPAPYGYGRVYSRDEIDRALRTDKPYEALGYHPASGDPTGHGAHGTHTCDIAAGNGRADGAPSGIAPEADIAFVHLASHDQGGRASLGNSVTLLEALDWISRLAGERPWVVNLSLGRHGGPHTGLTLVEQGIDALLVAAPGRCVVHSAGNYFSARVHASGTLRPGQRRTLRWCTDPADLTPNEIEVWYPGQDVFAVEVRSPGGGAVVRLPQGAEAALAMDGREVGRAYHRAHDPSNGDHHVDIFLDPGAAAGCWEVTLIGDDVVDGRFHAWVERDASCPQCQARFEPQDADPATTTGTICNGFHSLAVGAYDTHAPERDLATFSSSGPTRDGRIKPDLLAPGVQVLAARSASRELGSDTPLLTRFSGTSMAAPHVTGTVALMFEAAARPLTIQETRRLLLSTAAEASPGIPAARVGSGFLDIERAVEAARGVSVRASAREAEPAAAGDGGPKVEETPAVEHSGRVEGRARGTSVESAVANEPQTAVDQKAEVPQEADQEAEAPKTEVAQEVVAPQEAEEERAAEAPQQADAPKPAEVHQETEALQEAEATREAEAARGFESDGGEADLDAREADALPDEAPWSLRRGCEDLCVPVGIAAAQPAGPCGCGGHQPVWGAALLKPPPVTPRQTDRTALPAMPATPGPPVPPAWSAIPGPTGRLASPAELFDGLTGTSAALRRHYERHVEMLALPGERLSAPLREGDLLVRRALGEGGIARLAVLAAPELAVRQAAAGGSGMAAEGRVAFDQLLLRPRFPQRPRAGGEALAPEEDPSQPAAAPRRPDLSVPCPGPAIVLDRFPYDRPTLTPEHRAILDGVARMIADSQASEDPVHSICIEGHTDATGPDAYNLTLGQKRAATVDKQLRAAVERRSPGLVARLGWRSSSLGERRPVADNATPDGRARNRRAEIFLNRRWLRDEAAAPPRIDVVGAGRPAGEGETFVESVDRPEVLVAPGSLARVRGVQGTPRFPSADPAFLWSIADPNIALVAPTTDTQTEPNTARVFGVAPGRTQLRLTFQGQGTKRSAPGLLDVLVFTAQLELLDPAATIVTPPAANELVRPFPRAAAAVAQRTLRLQLQPASFWSGRSVQWTFTVAGAQRGALPAGRANLEAAAGSNFDAGTGRGVVDPLGQAAVRVAMPGLPLNACNVNVASVDFPSVQARAAFAVPGVVVIDPGHGGSVDTFIRDAQGLCKVSSGHNHAKGVRSLVLEKDVTLDVAQRVRTALQGSGRLVRIFLTRDCDINLPVRDRAAVARCHGADTFLSIHFNADPSNAATRGTETFVRAAAKQNVNRPEDVELAQAVLNAAVGSITGGNSRGVKDDTQSGPGGLGVLDDATYGNTAAFHPVRGCLLELEFLTNAVADGQFNPLPAAAPFRNRVAVALGNAIVQDLLART